jgi:hypothetical protein
VTCREESRNAYKILTGKSERTIPVGKLGVNGRITIKRILEKQDMRLWNGFM